MSIEQAMNSDIKFVRKPYWMEAVRLELLPYQGKGVLHDHLGRTVRIPLWTCDDGLDDWEESTPPPIRSVSIGTTLGQVTNKP